MPAPQSSLNPAQREAVSTLSGPLLILAGAGTGKTRVITYRMAELIRHRVAADRILCVTFTNKAAREMLERTTQLLGRQLRPRPQISTFHAYCVRVLRQEIAHLGYPPSFVIYDRGDQESAARTALRDIRIHETALRPGDLLAQIGRWKSAGVDPPAALAQAVSDLDYLAASGYRRYQQNLRACGAVDFDDLLGLTRQLFVEFPDVLARQQRRFDHVQIDEFQDTNGLQFELIEALVQSHRNLCVVGDDDQSIYGWRGAEIRHILNFQSVFPEAKVIRLVDNYRCTDQILQLANSLVKHNKGRHEKHLVAHKTSSDAIRVLEFPDELQEAQSIVRDIAYLVREQRVSPNDFAILVRTNEQPRPFESELRRQRLPYVVVGTQSFYDRREIRDLLAYLKAILQPQDDMSLLRIVNVPARGIGDATVEKIVQHAVRHKQRFWEAVPAAAAAGLVPPGAAAQLERFRGLLEDYRRRFTEQPRHLGAHLRNLLEAIQYDAEIERQYKDPQQQLVRRESLDQLTEALDQYVAGAAEPTLAEFLETSALAGGDDHTSEKDEHLSQHGVRLMTLHSAKGLEFPRVYLVGLEEGILPHRRSIEGPPSGIEEERRLMYVGITRARDFLTLSRAAQRTKWGKRCPCRPSRFLWEMRGLVPPPPPPAEEPRRFPGRGAGARRR